MKIKIGRYHHSTAPSIAPETGLTEAVLPVIEYIAEQMPGGFFIYRADNGEILFANSALSRIFGCESREEFREFAGSTFPGFIHPDDRARVAETIRTQIAHADNRNSDALEYRIIRKDGAVRYLEDYGRYVHIESLGDLYYVFVADVTEKHAIQEDNLRRARVIDGVSEEYASVYLLDLISGDMVPYRLQTGYMKSIAEELRQNGKEKSDWKAVFSLYGKRYVMDEDRALYLHEIQADTIRKRLQSEKSYQVDFRCFLPEGGMAYMCMNIVKIEEEDPRYVVMGYKNITRETLRVQQETTERMHTEMELEKMRQANELKSTFLFNVSHDIRTPMNAVIGFNNLAQRHMDDPELLRKYLDKVEKSSLHMLSLVDDLLEMSQIDVGGVQLHTEQADLQKELETAADLLRPQSEAKRISLTLHTNIPENRVLLDAVRFRRIMTNLIGNAVKFTPVGGSVEITAGVLHKTESGYARYKIAVTDNGVGMTREFLTRIFRPFEREQSSTRTGQTGTGLGLSIVKRLLDIMGGSISVRSKKGKGSVFTVELPLKMEDAAAGGTPSEDVPEKDVRAVGERRILLVEDIAMNRMLAEAVLEDAGFLVESVTDGSDAVEIVWKKPEGYYDLVLMDIQMPVMNGYEAARAIRAMDRSDVRTLPILALSANAREEDKRMSLENGMNAHIAKPFVAANLIETINLYIMEREEREAAAKRESESA